MIKKKTKKTNLSDCGEKKKKKREGGLRVWWGKSEGKRKKKNMGLGKKNSLICFLGPKCRIVKIC